MKSDITNGFRLAMIIFVAVAVAVAVVAALFAFSTPAHANPFYTGSKAQSASATSTQTYLRAGVATSTTIYDSYEQLGTNETNKGDFTIPDSVAVVIDGVASSTASVITVACEYSDNWTGSNGDWYTSQVFPFGLGTTTNPINIANGISYMFNYASSTVGGAALTTTTARFQKIVTCPMPTRFVRVIVGNTAQPASVWVQIIPKKQRNSGN